MPPGPPALLRSLKQLGLTALATSVLLVGGCASGPEEATAPVPPAPARAKPGPTGIQPGEKLDVFVMEDDSFSGSYSVRSTGDIIVPKLGRVQVGNLSAQGAEKVLSRELEKNTLTKATVLIDRATPASNNGPAGRPAGTEVFLSGKISRPGRYSLVGIGNNPPTFHQAVLQAGGCSRFAYKKKAHVLRRGADGKLYRINADLIAIESGAVPDVPLLPGDIVVVPEKKVDFGL